MEEKRSNLGGFSVLKTSQIEIESFEVKKSGGKVLDLKFEQFIQKYGQTKPVIIATVNGQKVILDGKRQFESCKKLGFEEVFAKDLGEMSYDDYVINRILLNYHNQRIDYLAVSEVLHEIKGNQKMIQAISNKTGIDKKDVERLSSLLEFDWYAYLNERASGENIQGDLFD